MPNVTIAMSDALLRKVRVDAAKAGKSMSRYIADRLAREEESQPSSEELERRASQLAALERVLALPPIPISENGRMPTAEERNARR